MRVKPMAFAYDVFLSHSSQDKPAVRELAQRLQADGLRVWLDEWEIQPGDMIGLQIEKGLEQSRTLILVMSQNAFASEWVTLERHTVLFRDPTNKDRRFIPLLLDQTDIPDILRQFAYVDWREPTDQQYARLLASCQPPKQRRTPRTTPAAQRQPGNILKGHTNWVRGVALSSDGLRAVSGSYDNTVRVWDLQTGRCIATLKGHTGTVYGVALSSDGLRVVSGSYDNTVRVWDLQTRRCIATLKGHIETVHGIALSSDGHRAVSGSADKTVRVWDLQTGQCTATLEGHTSNVWGVALSSDSLRAVSSSDDNTVRVWDLPPFGKSPTEQTNGLLYTNAKVLLVGDSGVGKSGLALRLAEDRFEATVSTDAAWATQLQLPHDASGNDIEREIWLWDFAGQADYRLTHQLYMDETALAAFVFNPQSENPFEGLGQWDRDLQRAARRPFTKLLVAGRCDRGGLMVSREAVEQFRKERGFDAYLQTSALSGEGCAELRDAIIGNIAWETIPWTSSPRIFKVLKEEIVKLKDEGKALLRMGELKQQLEMRLPSEVFTLEELRAVVGLLAGPGVVWQLEFGDFVLLQPERI
ncbi:MAG TPA: TIR domain-containing protein, partial [Chthonomonadaceae bacterium]|nr:TIR domain-containing protein [Chthonomonadaceae bacterium]